MTPALDHSLLRALYTVREAWQNSDLPTSQRELCARWLKPRYKEKFGAELHQSQLKKLCELGYLCQGELSRGGTRRYYTVQDINAIDRALLGFKPPSVQVG